MFCIHCGKELNDGMLFCTNCGKTVSNNINLESDSRLETKTVIPQSEVSKQVLAQEQQIPVTMTPIAEAGVQNTKHKLSKLSYGLLVALLISVVIICVCILMFFFSYSARVNRYLNLGQKYLNELNYEGAIAEFDKAIAIDDRCTGAYLGKLEVYVEMGVDGNTTEYYEELLDIVEGWDEDYIDEVVDDVLDIFLMSKDVYPDDMVKQFGALERGLIVLVNNERLIDAYISVGIKLADYYIGEGEYESGLDIIDKLLPYSEDEVVIEALEDCLYEYLDLLIKNRDYDKVLELIKKYHDIVEGLDEYQKRIMGSDDSEELESDLKLKLNKEVAGDIIETFFGDFNDDGKYEMWATVWDKEGIPYYDIVGGIDSWELAQNCESNIYNLDVGKEYRQLQIWYIDEETSSMIDDIPSILLTEDYVNGTSSYWGEDTFYYLLDLNPRMIQYGKLQQFTVSLEHTWMTGRGWGIEVDKTLAVYGNEKKPEVYIKESGSTIDYGVYGDSICVFEYEDYHLSDTEDSLALYYPIYYTNGKFIERSSIEINMVEIQKWKGYKKTYDAAMSKQLIFEKYVVGQAADVSYTLPVDNIEFEKCLYNDNGYIFLNGKASGMMEEWVSALFEDDQPLPYYSEIDVCLEMKLEDGEITEYRWLGAHQKKSATDYEKIPSKLSNATIIFSDDRADEKKEKQQKKVSLIVYTAEDVHVNGNRVELNGVIQESGENRTYIVDEDTEIIADTQFFSKYKNGMSGYAWLKKLSSEIDDSNWMDICGVYEMLVTGNHVDVITGLYWWD